MLTASCSIKIQMYPLLLLGLISTILLTSSPTPLTTAPLTRIFTVGWPRRHGTITRLVRVNEKYLAKCFVVGLLVVEPCSLGYISRYLSDSSGPEHGECSCFAYVMSPPTPTPLKCNYRLDDTKMRFLACGHSRRYLEFLNFRAGKEEGKERRERVGGGREKGSRRRSRRRRGMIEKRETRESFWEDAIMRTLHSETGCERQRLARQQHDAVHRFSALNGCQ